MAHTSHLCTDWRGYVHACKDPLKRYGGGGWFYTCWWKLRLVLVQYDIVVRQSEEVNWQRGIVSCFVYSLVVAPVLYSIVPLHLYKTPRSEKG
jgi:hypothetical protein